MEKVSKHFLSILSVILLFVTLALCWYSDALFDHFWMLCVPVYLFLFAWFATLLVLSIIFIFKEKRYAGSISLGSLLLIVLMVLFFPFRSTKVKLESIIFEKERMEVVEMIKNDESKRGYRGNYDLPAGHRKLSSDGHGRLTGR